MDKCSDYLEKFTKLAEAAEFYLHESFKYIHLSLESELAGILFGELIGSIDTSEKDADLMEKAVFPEKVVNFLTEKPPEVITDETKEKIDEMWDISRKLVPIAEHNF